MENKCLCKHNNYCGSIVFKENNYYRYFKMGDPGRWANQTFNTEPSKYVVFDENDMPYTFTGMVFKSLFETNKSILRDEIINQILK